MGVGQDGDDGRLVAYRRLVTTGAGRTVTGRSIWRNAPTGKLSGRPLSFNDEDTGFTAGMGNVFIARLGDKGIRGRQHDNALAPVFTYMHIDDAIEDKEHFGAVINVPDIGLVGPVHTQACAFNFGNVAGLPCPRGLESREFAKRLRHGTAQVSLLQCPQMR